MKRVAVGTSTNKYYIPAYTQVEDQMVHPASFHKQLWDYPGHFSKILWEMFRLKKYLDHCC